MAVCRIHPGLVPPATPVSDEVLDGFRALSTSVISDSMNRDGALVGLHRVGPPAVGRAPMVGRAFTVKVDAGDNLAFHIALDMLVPGDVVVVDAAGHLDRAITGELMVTYAATRGAVGIVIDGAVRDAEVLAGLDTPVFARGVTHLGPHKVGSGELRGPVVLGGALVEHGDVIVGDGDGIVRVPAARAATVLVAARATEDFEERLRAEIVQGRFPRPWLVGACDIERVGS